MGQIENKEQHDRFKVTILIIMLNTSSKQRLPGLITMQDPDTCDL